MGASAYDREKDQYQTNSFVVLGRIDTAVLLIALGAMVLTSLYQPGSSPYTTFAVLAFLILGGGVVINAVRRAHLMRREWHAKRKISAHLAELARLDAEDEGGSAH